MLGFLHRTLTSANLHYGTLNTVEFSMQSNIYL